MAYVFTNNHIYNGNLSGTDLINILQDKYGILNNFDNFVESRIRNGKINEYMYRDMNGDVYLDQEDFLTDCWKDYILSKAHGVTFKGKKEPLISSGNLLFNTKVTLE